MDWGAMLTLVFAGIGALTGILTVANEWAKRRAERRSREEAEASAWSLVARPADEVGQWTLVFRYDAVQEQPVAIRQMRIVAPRGAEIARFVEVGGGEYTRGKDVPDEQGWCTLISMDKDLSPGFLIAGMHEIRTMTYADYRLLGRVPAALLSNDGRTRFRISLTIEDRSALRRQRNLIVASQEITWTARKTDIQA